MREVPRASTGGTVLKTSLSKDDEKELLARSRAWIDNQADQVIIWGSLILGFW